MYKQERRVCKELIMKNLAGFIAIKNGMRDKWGEKKNDEEDEADVSERNPSIAYVGNAKAQ